MPSISAKIGVPCYHGDDVSAVDSRTSILTHNYFHASRIDERACEMKRRAVRISSPSHIIALNRSRMGKKVKPDSYLSTYSALFPLGLHNPEIRK